MAPKDPTERYQLLLRSATSLNSSLDLEAVMQGIVDSLIELTGAERGILALQDPSTGALSFPVARGVERQNLETPELEVSRTLIRNVLATGEGELLLSAADDPRFANAQSIIAKGMRSLCCAPLRHLDRVFGVVCVDNRMQAGVFKQADLEMLTAFADQAATALLNARLFGDLQARTEELSSIKAHQDAVFESMASGVIALDLQGRVTTFNHAAERIFGLQRAAVLGGTLWPALAERGAGALEERVTQVLQALRPLLGHRCNISVPSLGKVELSVHIAPLQQAGGRVLGVTMLVDDITERLRLEADLGAKEAQRRHLHTSLERLVSEDVAYLVEHRPDALSLSGQARTVTVLFSDIVGFSSIAERHPPERIIEMLNRYFGRMCEIVKRHHGTVKQFVGDEIMVLFNATRDHPAPAAAALLTAVEMIDMLRQVEATAGHDAHDFCRVKIGIHTGEVVVGGVGNEERLEFAAVGDNVNLASRIMGLNPVLGTQLLASQHTVQAAGPLEHGLEARSRGLQTVKGRTQPIEVFEIVRSVHIQEA